MESIYLCERPANVKNVFGWGLDDGAACGIDAEQRVYTRAELLSEPEKFADVKYGFSTWGMPVLTEEEIALCLPKLEAVFYGAGSVQAFARPFLSRGIKVFSAWAANAVPVAEYTVAQIVLANKGFFRSSRLFSAGDHPGARKAFKCYWGNYGACVGIIGAGMIGKLVINMLKAYDLKVLVFDPFLPDEKAAELGVEKCSLAELFARSAVVSNHLANNEQTKGMLNGALFNSMLPNAVFLNTGRGAQVVEADLIATLKARPDLTAVLDVTFPEPPVEGSELYGLDNCILTPHIAGSAGDEVRRMGKYMQKEYEKYINGKPCEYEVSMKMLETMA